MNLSQIPTWQLELEQVRRALAKGEASIITMETTLLILRRKQAAREREIARQLALHEPPSTPSPL